MNPCPLVSIAIPSYKPRFFEESLLSAFRQTHGNIEIVICDDCRDEGISRIVEQLRPQSPWPIRYMKNATPLGEALNAARCIREAQGEYIKFLYDDDILLADCVTRLVELIHGHPEIRIASSRRRMINEEGELLADNWATGFPFTHDVIFSGPELASFLGQFTVNFIGEPTSILCRREDLAAFGDDLMVLNGQSIEWVGDVSIYMKLLRQGHLAMLVEPLSLFRISNFQYSAQGRAAPNVAQQCQAEFQRRLTELGWSRSLDEYRMIKVATFADRHHFIEVDLLPYFATAHPHQHFDFSPSRWLSRRVLKGNQQALIDDRLSTLSEGSTLLIVVLGHDRQTRQITSTLTSIMEHQTLSAALSVVVFSSSPAPEEFQDAAHVRWDTTPFEGCVHALNQLLRGHHCDWFMLIEAGAVFTPQGLSRVRLKLPDLPRAPAIFADELHRSPSGRHETAFRPDFNLDYLLSYPAAMCKHWFFHRSSMLDAGGFDADLPEAFELNLILRLVENANLDELYHLCEPILICDGLTQDSSNDQVQAISRHLHVRGYADSLIEETAPGQYRIRYNHSQRPLVSILIPTKDQLGILRRCVESVLERTAYDNYEIIIIDNNSEEPDALQWLSGVENLQSEKVWVLRHPYPFNYSEINNTAARHARGEYLVLLNNDTAVLHPEWLDNLLNHALRPEVGIVGAKLYYPDGAIQHAGVVLGIEGPALHAFLGAPQDSPGYMNRLQVDQDYSVVTAACLMIRKSLYDQLGGLDEVDFKVSYNDVDLCLKVRESGHLVVWTPHVHLLHESSVSQVHTDTTAHEKKVTRFRGEQLAMYRKWLPVLARDPAYNLNLALTASGFKVEPVVDLTWRALPWRPAPLVLVQRTLRCNDGDKRVSTPLETLREQGLLDGAVSPRRLSIVEIERLKPEAIVFQQPFLETDLHDIELTCQLSTATRILDLDRLPVDYQVAPLFLRSLELVDRVIVASPRLAAALEGMHKDIRVVIESLPAHWTLVAPQRRIGDKPRIGWRGDHDQLDIELIAQIMPVLADEVDFVVMGWCPIELRPFVKDQRYQAQEADHPEALAQMNLDLALLPLRGNGLQGSQSVLRLLEYGACGFGVLCSEIAWDEETLPVTRLPNHAQAWIDAIRARVAEPDALALEGDALQRDIFERWILNDRNLQSWRDAWLA